MLLSELPGSVRSVRRPDRHAEPFRQVIRLHAANDNAFFQQVLNDIVGMRSDFDGNEVSVQAHVRESQCIKSLGKELDAFAVDLQSLLDKLLILQGSPEPQSEKDHSR